MPMMPTPQVKWSLPPSFPPFDDTTIQLWCFGLSRPAAEVTRLRSLLSADEQARADRFVFDKDRDHFTVGRGIMRTILARHLQTTPNKLAFHYGPQGKPELQRSAYQPLLHFNLSHSGGLGLLGLTRSQPLGVDIEAIRPLDDMAQIAQRFFAPQEYQALQSLPTAQQQKGFFNCWTRKEAYLKATGDGLRQPLDQFEVTLGPTDTARLVHLQQDIEAAASWSLIALTPAAGYVAAVAIPGQGWRMDCWQWAEE